MDVLLLVIGVVIVGVAMESKAKERRKRNPQEYHPHVSDNLLDYLFGGYR